MFRATAIIVLVLTPCCAGQPEPSYPLARQVVCQAGELLPDTDARRALRAACATTTAIERLAVLYEEARQAALQAARE